MNRLKLLATATLVALAFTACDEGTPPPVEPPPPPTPVGTISGSVTIEGTAAAGITATLSSGATTTTGSGGNFAFSGVEAGTYTVTISGFPEDATFAQVTQSATIASEGQNVQLNFAGEYIRSSAVIGNVVAADAMMSGGDGQPETLVGVTVTLGGEHAMGETMETAEDGGFAFTGLRAGTYTVTISDFPEDISFETVSVEVEVEVGEVGNADFTGHYIRTSAVEGQVIIEGEGLAAVTVTLSGGPADESYTAMTDADGMYRFEELRPGDYTVSISDFDTRDYEFAATSQDVSVDLDETGTVSFTGVLLRTSGISGRVSVEGMGLDGIAVTLSGAADDTTTTDAGGQYSFAGLAAGDYTVTIAVDDPAYVFDPMSMDRTVGDDDSQIVNFEGAHARTASVSGQLFLDELDKNKMMDAGEHPLAQAGIPVALVGPGVNDQRLSATGPDGSFMFPGLQAGSYQLVVPIDATVAAALAAADVAYGGPGTGYEITLGVGEARTQAVPFDITHTTVNFSVMLRHGDDEGDALPGAMVTLSSGESGTTGEDGSVAIKVARAGVEGNTVQASVSHDDYAAGDDMTDVTWDPQMFAVAAENANDIVNLNVEVALSGKTIETDYGGGVELAGWALDVMMAGEGDAMVAVEGAPEALGDDGTESFESELAVDDLPMVYYFAVAEDQDNELDGGESVKPDTMAYKHRGLSLAGAVDVAITASYATQTLKVYVHHERDQVEGFTGGVLGGDRRMSGPVEVEIRYVAGGGRSHAFANGDWDASKNMDEEDGVWTFSHVPADKDVIVVAEAASDAEVMILSPDQLVTFEDFDDNGVTGSAFGDMGGFHHTVELCPLQADVPAGQDHDECASFAYVKTYSVDGQVWKNGVERDDDDGFDLHLITEDPKDPVAVKDIMVDMEAVEGKNLAGEDESHNSTDKDGDATIMFDFEDMADGVYSVSVTDGWVATNGMGGDELPGEFLLESVVNDDGHLNIDVTPETGVLYGRITDAATDQPAEGVTVDVNGESDVTDASGRFIVEGFSKVKPPKKPIVVTLSGTGYVEKKDTIAKFMANEPVEHNLSVKSLGDVATVSGAVRDSDGDPVAGVEIMVNGKAPLNVDKKLLTGADGSYEALVSVGSVTVKPSTKMKVSFIPPQHTFTVVAGQDISGIDFVAYDHATITGRVLDGDDSPVQHVKVTATPSAGGDPTDSYTTRSTGAFALSVPFGSYEIGADTQNGSYSFKYPDSGQTVNVAPGQKLAFGDITATLSAGGRPPRFTSSASFSVEAGEREIGTVEAVDDDDDDEVKGYTVSGGDDADRIAVTSKGALQWAGTLPSYNDEVAANNKYKVTVRATSGPKAGATGTTVEKTADQKITVTLTPSGDAVVTMVVSPASISEAGGVSTVSATIDRASSTAFAVEVSVSGAATTRTVSGSTLFFAAGATESTGSVKITAVNNNAHNADVKLTVNGTLTPPSDDMTVKSVKLTIADDDVGPGRVVLRLVADATADPLVDESSIDESGDDNSTNLIAQVVGGTPYSQEVQVAVTIGDGATLASNTLTIAADARTSDAIVVTAATDDNDADEVVIITGTATLPDGGDDDTDRDPVSSANQPGDIILVVEDDDEDPSAPRNLDVDVTATAGDPRVLTINATWDAPSNLGKADGTDRTSVTYQYRFERSSVIDDAAWAIATSPQTIDLTTIAGVDLTNVWERDFTVELRVTLGTGATDPGVPGTTVTKEFRTPADPGDGS